MWISTSTLRFLTVKCLGWLLLVQFNVPRQSIAELTSSTA